MSLKDHVRIYRTGHDVRNPYGDVVQRLEVGAEKARLFKIPIPVRLARLIAGQPTTTQGADSHGEDSSS